MEKLVINDIKDFEFIDSGRNADVYKNKNNEVIKIYKKYINGEINKAPNLNLLKIYLISIKRNKLKKNELPKGIVFIGKKIRGVLYNYKIGDNLLKLQKNLSFDKKILYSKILVEKSKELTDNKIYCLDYKLNNVVCNDIPNFIDLDDWLTKYTIFKNKRYLKETLYRLREMILELLIDDYNINLNKEDKIKALSKYECINGLIKETISYNNILNIINTMEDNFSK